jgi:ankyrin repeat protein
MYRVILFLLLSVSATAQKNILLDAAYWRTNPSLDDVRTKISERNDPAELNAGAFDPVVMAINNGASNDIVKFLLTQPGNDGVNKLTHDGRTYLHWASSRNNYELVDLLINKGYDINFKDSHGSTPLAFAASSGLNDPKIFDRFFAAGVDPKARYSNGATILHLAIPSAKDLGFVDYFVGKGLTIQDTDENGATLFDYAARGGNIDNMKELVKRGVKPTGQALIFAGQGARRSSNPIEVYKYLIDEVKLSAKATNSQGENVLHLVARKPKQQAIVAYLLDRGADANQVDKQGNTPLIRAASGELDVIQQLVKKTRNISHVNAKGESALTIAVLSGSAEGVGYLISNNAKTDVMDKDGNNLMYHLIQSYRTNAKEDFMGKLALLERSGVNPTLSQKDGNTLYHLAVAKNDLALMDVIKKYDININASNKEGLTPLHKAAMLAKDDSMLKYLVANGAKTDVKTEFDETAYDLARENELLAKSKTQIEFLK